MKKLIFMIMVVFLLVGCSSPVDTSYDEEETVVTTTQQPVNQPPANNPPQTQQPETRTGETESEDTEEDSGTTNGGDTLTTNPEEVEEDDEEEITSSTSYSVTFKYISAYNNVVIHTETLTSESDITGIVYTVPVAIIQNLNNYYSEYNEPYLENGITKRSRVHYTNVKKIRNPISWKWIEANTNVISFTNNNYAIDLSANTFNGGIVTIVVYYSDEYETHNSTTVYEELKFNKSYSFEECIGLTDKPEDTITKVYKYQSWDTIKNDIERETLAYYVTKYNIKYGGSNSYMINTIDGIKYYYLHSGGDGINYQICTGSSTTNVFSQPYDEYEWE